MIVFQIGLVVDLLALLLWALFPPVQRRPAVEPITVTIPAAMLRTGYVREYGNPELARHVRITRALLDTRGRR